MWHKVWKWSDHYDNNEYRQKESKYSLSLKNCRTCDVSCFILIHEIEHVLKWITGDILLIKKHGRLGHNAWREYRKKEDARLQARTEYRKKEEARMSTPHINEVGMLQRLKDIDKELKTEFDLDTRNHLIIEYRAISQQLLATAPPNLSGKNPQAHNLYCI